MCIPRRVLPLLCLLGASAAAGSGLEPSVWSFNGYGTVGAMHSNEDRADYEPSMVMIEGPGRSGSWSVGVDSRLGAQIGFHPTPRLSAVVQVVAEDRLVDDYEPKLEWAHINYELTPNVTIGAGRTALDTFLVSAHRKVGYALHWARPPAELYRTVSITSSDGVQVGFNLNRADVSWRTTINYGQNDADEVGGQIAADELIGIFSTLDWGAATLHAAYLRAKLDSPVTDPFFDLLDPFGPEGAAVRREHDLDGKWASFTGLGASYDPGTWFLMAEWGRGNSDSIAGISEGWYLSGGYRFGRVAPYVTFADAERGHNASFTGLTVAAYPPMVAPVAAGVNAILAEARAGLPDQSTLSIGARWDVMRSVAAKVQYDRVDVHDGFGTFSNVEPGFQPSRVDLFSVSVDFLF